MSATFNNTKTVYIPDNSGGVMVQVDPATPVDNIFVFASGGYKFKWTPNFKGVYNLSQARILGNSGSDQTALMQSILNSSSIQTVVLDAQQQITIDGTLNAQGKVIQFTDGSLIKGSGTITNAIIDAQYEQQIFDTTITLSGCKLVGDYFSVKWFGAQGNFSNDDYAAIQKCIDTIVGNNTLVKTVYFPQGNYKISQPLIISNWNEDTQLYDYTSVNLIGQPGTYFSNETAEAIISPQFVNTFAIGVQHCRSLVISGLVIRGGFAPNWSSRPRSDYYEGDYSTWASQWGVRDSPYSPYAGIVIDPFRMDGVVPPDGGYPGLTMWYRGNTQGGSSGVTVRDCRIDGFTVGILLSPGQFTYNAENFLVDTVTCMTCKVIYASSQRQEKNNKITKLVCWAGVHTVLDSSSYGQLQGCPPNIDGVNLAGEPGLSVVRLFYINGLQFNVTFKNIYAEVLYSIGVLRGGIGMITLEGCSLDFNGVLPLVPHVHADIQNVKIDSCNILYYDDLFDKRVAFSGDGNIFINCRFDRLPYFIDQIESPKASNDFYDCKTHADAIGFSFFKGAFFQRAIGLIPTRKMTVESAIPWDDFILRQYLEINAGCPDFYRSVTITGNVFSLNESTRIGTFTTSQSFWVALDDYVLGFDLTLSTYVSLGRVTAIDLGTGQITVSEVPWGVDDSHSFYIAYIPKIKRVHAGFYCTATQNVAALSNLDYDNWGGNMDNLTNAYLETFDNVMQTPGALIGGAYFLYGNDIYVPNYGVDGDGSVVEYIISIATPDVYAATFPASTLLMKTNTIWVNKARGATTNTRTFRFTTGGYLNAAGAGKTRQAVWLEI